MIDIHSHILPGVDDGAQSMEESVGMAQAAVEEGIDTIVATPHHQNGEYNNYKHDILIQVSELNRVLEEREVPLTVLPGQESRISGDMVEGIKKEEILTINEGHYVFVEFPHDQVPNYASNLLFNLQVEGYQPVIVHPERNEQLQDNPNLLYSFVKKGAFSQVTAASIVGKFGRPAKKLSHQLIEANLAHLIASDAHKSKGRTFYMRGAFSEIKKQHGQEMVHFFSENAQYLIDSEPLASEPPEHVKKKKVLGIF
ncbi:tyrosine-protein phosphatase [Halobacillus sp. A5]|uniref:tyrosine-protein phosphatase n=1 Tax=Halobacillus sp. A5 TaxID=2880263 RepID=UPI0020A6D7B7|nr:CpsB/CapC family capsule biosynthesis tyrosine phosphatase [Halobacillus sp. A5]MCP3029516.1 tyrosine protein phosphatase [Halobacillus sp. A5]